MNPRVTRYVVVRIQDYAADAFLRVYKEDDFRVRDYQQIPENFRRFWSNADPDSDGFTNWEEYRGFVDRSFHTRTDSTRTEFFFSIDDAAECFPPGIIDYCAEMACNSFAYYNTEAEEHVDEHGSRYFLDFMSHYGEDTLLNPFCLPANMPGPYDWLDTTQSLEFAHQGEFHFVTAVSGPVTGWTDQQLINDTVRQVVWCYPGGSGLYQIELHRSAIIVEVDNMQTNFGLPNSLFQMAKVVDLERNVAHEFGHALGLRHHNEEAPWEGDCGCIMTYWWMNASDPNNLPSDSLGWVQWLNTYGTGYGFQNDQWGCRNKFRFRP